MCLPGWHETAFAEEEISEPGRMNRASRKEEEEKECLQEERSNMRGGRWRVDALKFSAYSGEAGRLDAWSLGAVEWGNGFLSSWEVTVNVGLGKLSCYPFSSGWLNHSKDI